MFSVCLSRVCYSTKEIEREGEREREREKVSLLRQVMEIIHTMLTTGMDNDIKIDGEMKLDF